VTATLRWRPRLVALDVDGTLLDPETQSISARVRDAVRRVVGAGSHVVIATGRSVLGTLPILDELGLSRGVALCSNGAVKVDAATHATLGVETFDPAPVHAILAARLPGAIFAAEQVGTRSLVTSRFREHELHGPQQVASIDELTGAPVPRFIANWVEHEPAEVTEALRKVGLPGCTYTIDHYLPWVTVVPDGVTKGSALEKLRTELGILADDTFAAGDGDNDIHMLQWAAHGVAMGQAPDIVRAAATEITGSVAEDGLATALDRWFR
jgi:Cof subfamily protein (haloacid dehalogenase superfamily)